MLRLIGVIFLVVVAQFLVHGWVRLSEGLGTASIDAWKQSLDSAIERDFPRE
jgi:hypothetical protein